MSDLEKQGETPRTNAFCVAEGLGEVSAEEAFHKLLDFTGTLERELAQMAAQKAEAQRDAERYRWLRDNGKLKTWEGLTYWTKDERTFETAIDTALAAERKESGNG